MINFGWLVFTIVSPNYYIAENFGNLLWNSLWNLQKLYLPIVRKKPWTGFIPTKIFCQTQFNLLFFLLARLNIVSISNSVKGSCIWHFKTTSHNRVLNLSINTQRLYTGPSKCRDFWLYIKYYKHFCCIQWVSAWIFSANKSASWYNGPL